MKMLSGLFLVLICCSSAHALVGGTPVDGSTPVSKAIEESTVKLVIEENYHSECTGVIIAPDMILTAAHCVTEQLPAGAVGPTSVLNSKSAIRVEFNGRTDPMWVDIKNFVVDQPFLTIPQTPQAMDLNNTDLAVIQLAYPIPGPQHAIELLPASVTLKSGDEVFFAGFGSTPILKMASFKIKSPEFNAGELSFPRVAPVYTDHGDSGGPLMTLVNGKLYVAGTLSRGRSSTQDTIFGSAQKNANFIQSAMQSLRATHLAPTEE